MRCGGDSGTNSRFQVSRMKTKSFYKSKLLIFVGVSCRVIERNLHFDGLEWKTFECLRLCVAKILSYKIAEELEKFQVKLVIGSSCH